LSDRERTQHLRRLGDAIRSARTGLTQARLGAILDVPQTTISRWEKGQVALDVIQIFELELALGLVPGSLLSAAGLIASERKITNVAKAIVTDPNVDPALRFDLLTIYGNYVMLSKRPRR
jgi:transcriptional regulator with XRE-family HTH domain